MASIPPFYIGPAQQLELERRRLAEEQIQNYLRSALAPTQAPLVDPRESSGGFLFRNAPRPIPPQNPQPQAPLPLPIMPTSIVEDTLGQFTEDIGKVMSVPYEELNTAYQSVLRGANEPLDAPQEQLGDVIYNQATLGRSDISATPEELETRGVHELLNPTETGIIKGVSRAIPDPMNYLPAAGGKVGAAVLAGMLPGAGIQALEAYQSGDQQALAEVLTGLALPLGIGMGIGRIGRGPKSVQPVETPLSAVRGSRLAAGVDPVVSIDSLHMNPERASLINQMETLVPEEQRFAEASRLVENFEKPETQRMQEINLDTSLTDIGRQADAEVLHGAMQDPVLQKADRHIKRIYRQLDEAGGGSVAKTDPGLGLARSTLGYAKDFQTRHINPTDIAKHIWDDLGLRGAEAADAYKSYVADTAVHEQAGHIDSGVGHGAPEQNARFAEINRRAQEAATEAKRQTDAMLSGTLDDMTAADVEALRNLHHQEMEVSGGQIQSLSRLEQGSESIKPSYDSWKGERIDADELTEVPPLEQTVRSEIGPVEPVESVNVDELSTLYRGQPEITPDYIRASEKPIGRWFTDDLPSAADYAQGQDVVSVDVPKTQLDSFERGHASDSGTEYVVPREVANRATRLQNWEQKANEARARIEARKAELGEFVGGNKEAGAAPNIGEDIIDYSLILRHKLAQSAVDFATWTKELPEHLQEHAQRIWDSVQNYHAKASNPANMLKGKNLTKLSPDQLETFARLKTEDVAGILKTAEDPVAAAKLIVRAKHPSAPPETQRLLTQRLMQEQGIKPPPGKPPKAEVQGPPAPRPESKVQSVEDYIGLKQSLETKQELTAREFTQYRSEGRQGLDNFEADPSKYPDAEKFLSDMFDYQQAHGVPINKLADYLPHLYEGSSKDIKAYNSWLTRQVGKLGLKPGHTLARKLASYKVAEEAFGLKPKFDNLPDLLGKYRYMAEKAVADRQLFDYAKDNKLISTVHKPGWVELPNFPVRHVKTAAGKPVEIKYFGEPAFAQKVNRVFQEPSTVAKILSGIASHGRNITLGAGIPGTGWNGYGLILMNRYVKSAPDIATGIGRVMHAVKDLTLTKQAGERVQGILDEIPDAIEHGLNLSTESRHWQPRDESLGTRLAAAEPFDIGRPGIQESKVGGAVLKKFTQVGEVVGTLFDRPLTERVLPLWKMIVYKQGIEDFTAQGLDPKAAKIKAAEWANNVMTGRNWQRAGSSPEAVAWSRVFFLAPDLLRSNMELGRGIGRGLFTRRGSPEAKLYRRYAKTAFTLFVAQQALSKALGGRAGWENPSGQAFSIYAGESDKDHERYIRPTLTSEDWARIPIELSASLSSGDEKKAAELLNNRASTLVNWAMHALTQRNYAGVPLSGMGIPAGRAMLNNAMEATNLGVPPQLGWGLEALKHVEPVGDLAKEYKLGRKRTPEEIFSGLLEAPVSYIKKRKKKSEPLGIFDFHQNFSKSRKGGEDEGGVDVVFK